MLTFVEHVITEYNLPVALLILYIGYLLNKKMSYIDKAVNDRPADSPTLSKEVSEIHRKVDVLANEMTHMKDDIHDTRLEIEAHRLEDERVIADFSKDISEIRDILNKKNTRSTRKKAS